MMLLCGQLTIMVVNLLHATTGVLKLSLVLDDVRVLLRFYLTVVCQVLALFYMTVRLIFFCVRG